MNPDLSAIQLPTIASPGSTPSPAVTGGVVANDLSKLTQTTIPNYTAVKDAFGFTGGTKPAEAPKVTPTVISSAPAEKKVASATETLAQAETQMANAPATTSVPRVFRVGSALYNADTNKPLTTAEANAVLARAGGDLNRIAPGELPATAVDEAIAGTEGTTAAPTREKTAAELGLESSMVQLSQLKEQMDATSKAYINSIEREYDTIIKQQELANKAFEGGVTVEGIRSGRARYAPVMQYSLLNEAVSAGIGKIAALNSKKQSLIIQAQQARDENNFKMLSKTIDTYRETIKEERQAAKDAAEAVYKAAEEARAAAEADRKAIEFTQSQEVKTAEDLAPLLRGYLTGDKQADDEFILKTAEEAGITNPGLFLKSVYEYDAALREAETKNFTNDIKEYQFARNEGSFNGNIMQWKAWQQSIAKTASDAANAGINLPANDPIFFAVQSIPGVANRQDAIQQYTAMIDQGLVDEANQYVDTIIYNSLGAQEKKSFNTYQKIERVASDLVNKLETFKDTNVGPWKNALERGTTLVGLKRDPAWQDFVSKTGLAQSDLRNAIFGSALTDTEKQLAYDFLVKTEGIYNTDTPQTALIKLQNLVDYAREYRTQTFASGRGQFGLSSTQSGSKTSYIITDPETGESRVFDDLTEQDLAEAADKGYVIN